MQRKLILENGMVFEAEGFGSTKSIIAEIVFNTSMVGYPEILSDPSYTDQMVIMTYPLIGNYGMMEEDYESRLIGPSALIVSEYNDKPSNFRYTQTLKEVLEDADIPALTHIDTRMLTRIIRDHGSMLAMITDETMDTTTALQMIHGYTIPHDQIAKVSCKKKWYSRCANPKYNVVAIDCGIKTNIIRQLNAHGCNVTIVPYDITSDQLMALRPDGVFISNGPGDPRDVPQTIALIRSIQGKLPIFGICMGHQLIALANGLTTYKLKFGHRGGNHPVKNLLTGKIEITAQNHSYAVCYDPTIHSNIQLTHINLLDQTVEGIAIAKDHLFSVQYHPESAPGAEDSGYLFDQFISWMDQHQKEKKSCQNV